MQWDIAWNVGAGQRKPIEAKRASCKLHTGRPKAKFEPPTSECWDRRANNSSLCCLRNRYFAVYFVPFYVVSEEISFWQPVEGVNWSRGTSCAISFPVKHDWWNSIESKVFLLPYRGGYSIGLHVRIPKLDTHVVPCVCVFNLILFRLFGVLNSLF